MCDIYTVAKAVSTRTKKMLWYYFELSSLKFHWNGQFDNPALAWTFACWISEGQYMCVYSINFTETESLLIRYMSGPKLVGLLMLIN